MKSLSFSVRKAPNDWLSLLETKYHSRHTLFLSPSSSTGSNLFWLSHSWPYYPLRIVLSQSMPDLKEGSVHLRPCRRQAGRQRGALGECGTGRRVCKSDKSREKMSKIPGAGNRELHRGFFTGQDFVFCLQMVA